jgi:hypothetical protein
LFPYVTWAPKEEAKNILLQEVENVDNTVVGDIPGSGMMSTENDKIVKMDLNEVPLEDEPIVQENKEKENNEINDKNEMEVEKIIQEDLKNQGIEGQKLEIKAIPTEVKKNKKKKKNKKSEKKIQTIFLGKNYWRC